MLSWWDTIDISQFGALWIRLLLTLLLHSLSGWDVDQQQWDRSVVTARDQDVCIQSATMCSHCSLVKLFNTQSRWFCWLGATHRQYCSHQQSIWKCHPRVLWCELGGRERSWPHVFPGLLTEKSYCGVLWELSCVPQTNINDPKM